MKVALVLERFDVARGGAERSTYEMALSLHELGVQVTVVTSQAHHGGTHDFPFSIEELPVKAGTRVGWWREFERTVTEYLSRNPYDIVQSISPLSVADIYQPRGGSILYSSRRHAFSYPCPVGRRIKRITSWMNRGRQERISCERQLCTSVKGPAVAALSHYVAEQFRHEYALDSQRIRIVPNGVMVDTIRNEETQNQGQKLRQMMDARGGLTLFLFAAENYRLKGLHWLIRSAGCAAERLDENDGDFRIIVAGNEMYADYWKQAQKTAAAGKVVFIGPTRQMSALLNSCDAVVLPTYNDACSRLILEGLAAGKPGITTRFNGASDFLDRGKYGIVIDECDDVEALANALLVVTNREKQKEMVTRIEQDRVHEKVSMRRHARDLAAIYEEMIESRK